MATPAQAKEELRTSWLARQPILSKDEKVVGYELLFREAAGDTHFHSDGENATSTIIDTLNVIGLDAACDGQRAFINCTHQMLLREYFLLLPPDQVVIELQHDIPADDLVVSACQRLKNKKYSLALDNFAPDDPREPLTRFADYIKVDIRKFSPEQNTAIASSHKQTCLIAQKVETRLQMVTAVKDGYTLFQGYFFRKPEKMRSRHIPANQAEHLRLLQAVSAQVIDFDQVEKLIKHDASLCYRLLRYLNSPVLGLASTVQSIRHGMSLLGERELVRWIRMATTLLMAGDKCSDLVLSSLVRARFCELIAPKVPHIKSDLFLMGMLSMMDSVLELPMGVVIEGLPLDPDMKAELLQAKIGRETPLTPIYRLMLAREVGEWEDVTAFAKQLNLSLPFVNRSFNEAMIWAREVTAGVPGSK